ncbi:MAG: spore coat protein CotJB [Clostridia bacterium]|nr:spore coat protein CotJB [Clostridia bacterium]
MLIDNGRNRERLLRQLQIYSFMVYDTLLYLDAYPDSKEALQTYNKYKSLESKAMAEYESKYGPVTAPQVTDSWEWTQGPWPWQLDKEGK